MPRKTEKQIDFTHKGIMQDTSLESVCKAVGSKTKYWLMTKQADYSIEYVDGNTIIHVTRHAGADNVTRRQAKKAKNAANTIAIKRKYRIYLTKSDYDIAVFLDSADDPKAVIKEAIRQYMDSHK